MIRRYALIEDSVIKQMGLASDIFPNTSLSGEPDADVLAFFGAMPVEDVLPFDHTTHKMVGVTPYIDGDVVRTVEVMALTTEELAELEAVRKAGILSTVMDQAQAALDKFAQDRGYGGIISVCTYDSSSIPRYAQDALRARTLRDQWWQELNVMHAEILAGTRPEPNGLADLLPDLPALTWE
jgi:hypothetical protein